jgi:hypothetical protein
MLNGFLAASSGKDATLLFSRGYFRSASGPRALQSNPGGATRQEQRLTTR